MALAKIGSYHDAQFQQTAVLISVRMIWPITKSAYHR
jgi:hypothetical protein